jgi:hypothetical protein
LGRLRARGQSGIEGLNAAQPQVEDAYLLLQ